MKRYVKWGRHFYQLTRIATSPELQVNTAHHDIDPISHRGFSIRELRKNIPVPASAEASGAYCFHKKDAFTKGNERDEQTLASDILINGILVSGITDPTTYIVKRLGKNIALNTDHSLIVVWDKYSRKIRAFRSIHRERDLHTSHMPRPDSTGLIASAFAEVAVREEFASCQSFLEAAGTEEKLVLLPKVRIVFSGYQVIYDCCASPGQLDRGEVPNQWARVLYFNKEIKRKMLENGLPESSEISITSHSLGFSNAILSKFYWQNHSDFAWFSNLRDVTAIEPVAAIISLRKIARLIATARTLENQQTDMTRVIDQLVEGVDVTVITTNSPIRSFLIHDSSINNKLAGRRGILLKINMHKPPPNIIVAFDDHMCANIAREMYKEEENPVTINTEKLHLLSSKEVAAEPSDESRKNFRDRLIWLISYVLLARWMATGQYDNRGNEKHLVTIIKDIGETLNLKRDTIATLINSAQVTDKRRLIPAMQTYYDDDKTHGMKSAILR